jgi:hypothetical protein
VSNIFAFVRTGDTIAGVKVHCSNLWMRVKRINYECAFNYSADIC